MPFGPLAFFPGHLSHPNELLVLLGDNHFLECTASRAGRICEGRLRVLKEKTAKVREEEKRVRERMEAGEALLSVGRPQLNEEGEEIVEIKEEYEEEAEEEGEEEEESTFSYGPAPSAPFASSSGSSAMSDAEFNAYWDRLAELEEEEEEKKAQQSKAPPRAQRSAPKQYQPALEAAGKAEEEEQVALPAIRSPADIYKQMKARREQHQQPSDTAEVGSGGKQAKHAKQVSFSAQPSVALIDPVSTRPLRHHTHSPPPPAASILPHSASTSSSSSPLLSAVSSSSILPPSSNPALLSAFSGAVHERAVDLPAPTPPAVPAPAPKKMSRFMAQRMGIPFEE